MKNRLLSLLLVFALCLSLFTVTVIAADPGKVYVGGVGMNDGDYLATGANEVSDNAPAFGGYAYYKDGILTLNDYEYFGEGYVYDEEDYYYRALIYSESEEDLEIVIKGKNYLKTHDDDDGKGIFLLYDANLTISGDGSLVVVADNEAIRINGDGGVTIKSGTLYLTSDDEEGIQAGESGDITILDGTVIIKSDEEGLDTEDGDVKISGGAVYIKVFDDGDHGIYAEGDVIISGGTVDIETYDGDGISGHTVTFSGGEITISIDNEDSEYFAVKAYEKITLVEGVSIVEPKDGSVSVDDEYEYCETIIDSDGDPATDVVIKVSNSGDISLSGIGAIVAVISELDAYHIDMENIKHGKVTVSKDMASACDIVTLTPVADRGYELARIRVLDENGKEVKLTAKGNGSYTFTMPSGDVTVGALFEQCELTLGEMTTSDILTSDSITAQLIRVEAAK